MPAGWLTDDFLWIPAKDPEDQSIHQFFIGCTEETNFNTDFKASDSYFLLVSLKLEMF